MSLPAGYTSRPAQWHDLDAVAALLRDCDLADVGFADPVRGHIEETWRTPTFDLASSTLLVLLDDDRPVAYAEVSGHHPALSLEGYGRVHPDHRRRGVGSALIEWIERRASRDAPPMLYLGILSTDTAAGRLLRGRGCEVVRTFWHMEIDPARRAGPVSPEGIEIRPYRHDSDVRAVHDALEEAFQGHWRHEPYPFDQHAEEMGRADPRIAPVATYGGEVVGAAVGRVLEDTGWIDVLGVRPPWRGRGIAKALLLRCFEGFSGLGSRSVLLNVDSENATGATRLYESVGMRVRRSFDVYEMEPRARGGVRA